MSWIIWGGALLSVLGIIGIIYSIIYVRREKKNAATQEDMNAILTKILPLNLGSLVLSAVGLMIVVLGILLV